MKSVGADNQSTESKSVQDTLPRTKLVSAMLRYAVAVLCVLVAFSIRYWLSSILGDELPLMLFVAASLVAAWYGGAATGIVALLLGLLLAEYFFLPAQQPNRLSYSVTTLQFIRYFFTASLGIILIEVLHRDRRRAQTALEQLQEQIERRRRTESALREAQTQLRQHAEELEVRVADRTQRLSATVEALRALLYHIAHNLKAPLRAMEGYSSLLATELGSKLAPAPQQYLRHIAEAARRMDQLIDDLLEYGRLGHREVVLSRVSLQRGVERALSNLAYEIQTQQARVEVVSPLPEVLADAEVLQQVLTNLLENALRFVAPGVVPCVRVRAEPRGLTVRLWIEDNGIGIDPHFHERIFGVFEALYPSHGHEGTGMGLAIVKQGMQRLGGQVGVQSHFGAGSRFWVEFITP